MIQTYSVIGDHHKLHGTANQDAILNYDGEDYSVIALADGVTACDMGGAGAAVACDAVCRLIENAGDIVFGCSPEKLIDLTVKQVRHSILAKAGVSEAEIDRYASTLIFAALEKSTGRIAAFSLGDSLIYFISSDGLKIAPCCRTETPLGFTTSEDAADHASVIFTDSREAETVMLCSDGAWKLFYKGNSFDGDLTQAAKKGDYSGFGTYLDNCGKADDCSFILMDIPQQKGDSFMDTTILDIADPENSGTDNTVPAETEQTAVSDDARQLLMENDTVSLRSININTGKATGKEVTDFTIQKCIGMGGSSVCYIAYCENDGTTGRLKELYPKDDAVLRQFSYLRRNADGQLYVPAELEGTHSDFERIRGDVLEAYCNLATAMNDQDSVLPNYISPFELYEGITEDGITTVYVWTQQDKKVEPFDAYLLRMKKELANNADPAAHLYTVIDAVMNLAKCISVLHTSDLWHLDIKPGNFGMCVDENGTPNPASIYLFDVNTIFPAGTGTLRTAGSDGFRALEILKGKASGKSDIYSLGATLFNAIVVYSGESFLYTDSYYKDLDMLVAGSDLIRSSDLTQNTELVDSLVRILKNCLATNPRMRYSACSVLVKELADAKKLLQLEDAKKAIREEKHDTDGNDVAPTGATGAIQQLLYDDPLYNCISPNGQIRVLVLGIGAFSRRFIDIAFEAAQTGEGVLHITAVSDKAERDRERFESTRPAFCRFFTVNGRKPEEESLGYLDFVTTGIRQFSKNDSAGNRALLRDIPGDGFDYVFIALGNDALNLAVAADAAAVTGLPMEKIAFVRHGERSGVKTGRPVFVDEESFSPDTDPKKNPSAKKYEELRRMAFNCHLLWSDSPHSDIRRKKGEFSSPSNFNSSFSNALSIKYKLHSVGISMDDPIAAADKFATLIENDNGAALGDLIMYEHRRWLVNLICNGWDTLTDFNSLPDSDTKDKKHKLHPCLRSSGSEWTLSKDEWTADYHRKWDTASKAEIAALDPLDRMSVELHRHFRIKAKKAQNTYQMHTDIDKLRYTLRKYPAAVSAFDRMILCRNNIAEGKPCKTELYSYYKRELEEVLKTLPKAVDDAAHKTLRAIDEAFYPILQSRKFTDYKEIDRRLIRGIPFILTYSASLHLCIPFGIEAKGERDNRVLFENIAASMVLDPSVITYIIDTDDFVSGEGTLIRALRYAATCMEARNTQARIKLLFIEPEGSERITAELKEKLTELSPRIGSINVIRYSDDTELSDNLINYLERSQSNKRTAFSAIQKNSTGISKLMRGMGCYGRSIPSFSFDSPTGTFTASHECRYFKHVRSSEYLLVSDMFTFLSADSTAVSPELQDDYEYFWNIYKSKDPKDKNEQVWKHLCSVLKRHAEVSDVLAVLDTVKKKDEEVKEARYIIPHFCREAAELLIKKMREFSPNLTGNNPSVTYRTPSTVQVCLRTTQKIIDQLDELFSDPYSLQDASKLNVYRAGKNVCITFDRLTVSGLPLNALTGAKQPDIGTRATEILRQLSRDRYIINYKETAGENGQEYVSFCYSSPQIKALLTTEGRILELYVYYKALEQNYFDDVVTGCEIIWNEDNVSSEFDIILTKGFRSLIVECKAQSQIEQNFYYKLAGLDKQFGINSTPILIADTMEVPWFDNSANSTQRSRGNELGIITVFERDQICADAAGDSNSGGIGAKLRSIMEEMIGE